ncbi:hypothetical protein [Rheinheimera maricola]|uniref:Uncharacterized protein n=1 Tax=Rheinheimera maricola TaxID=2793282 RepID=A0ABS7X3E9_9GAMM|nr:hypothetical protein [Rheinheimera maricola]MBZ9610084.1 hypothetical protein [Rheinheimera maricola]
MNMDRDSWIAKLAQTTKDDVPHCAYVATGVFLQSLSFHSLNDVHISGYIWQKVPIAPDCPLQAKAGFYFPDAIEGSAQLNDVNQKVRDDETLTAWFFETTLRQKFDYNQYPLDQQTVKLRILSDDFYGKTILIPDFNAYNNSGMASIYGVESDMLPGDWLIAETFFDFKTASYHSNLGYPSATAEQSPELHFNLVLKRNNAFVVNFLPALAVAVLLFAVLLTISRKRRTLAFNSFSIKLVIGAISALCVVVLLLQLNTRAKFATQSIVYIEYFYLLLYIAIIVVLLCSFVVKAPLDVQRKLAPHNFVLAKLLYWPSLLLAMAIISFLALF